MDASSNNHDGEMVILDGAHSEQELSITQSSNDDSTMSEPQFVFHGNSSTTRTRSPDHYIKKNGLRIVLPSITRRWEYQAYMEPSVKAVLREYDEDEGLSYFVRLSDGSECMVSNRSLLLGHAQN